ncbi:hypothetical protein [Fictibacillus solisalsi]|uniref:hypothetical protein n=1 Tax=Fictibacillus solisalsi TaxID=459525 RepID=UPI000B7FCD4E|nr:hypothetical protein [Fictibacillus solisalsi]
MFKEHHNAAAGWSPSMVSIWFIGGLQLMGNGEFIGKILIEVIRRPKYSFETGLHLNKAGNKSKVLQDRSLR